MKKVVIAIFAFVLLVGFIGCSTKQSAENTITYMRWGNPSEVASTKELITLFEKQNPDIKVNFQNESWGAYWDKLQTLLAAGDAPDVFLLGASYVVDFFDVGAIKNLTPFIEKDNFDLSDFFDPPKQVFTFNGDLYGLPRDINTVDLYYNKNLFDEAGVSYPNKNWTWQDIVEKGKKLTRDLDGDGSPDIWAVQVINDFETGWGSFLYQNNGHLLNPKKTKCLLYENQAIETFNFLYSLSSKLKIAPKSAQQASLGDEPFLTGKLAMNIAGSWLLGHYTSAINSFSWDVEELPKGKIKATIANGVANVMATTSKKPEKAWEFIKFLSGKEAQTALAKSGTSIPVRKSIAYSPVFLDGHPANKKAVLDSIAFGRNYPTTAKLGEWLQAIVLREVDYIFMGKKSPREALTTAANLVDKQLHAKQK